MNDDQQTNDELLSNDPFADFDEERTASAPETTERKEDENGYFANTLFTKKITTRNRTFFIDLKKSMNGKFLKISEKSRGKKSTIMMDAEDVNGFIEALNEAREAL